MLWFLKSVFAKRPQPPLYGLPERKAIKSLPFLQADLEQKLTK